MNNTVILSHLSIYSGCLFEVDHSTVSRIIEKLEPLLAKAIPLPKERFLSQEAVMCLVDVTEQSIERLRGELERKITIRERRSKNYHMIVIKTGLGRAPGLQLLLGIVLNFS